MNAITITPAASENDLETIRDLARRIWHEHYPAMISPAQIDYMLVQGYATPTMRTEIEDGTRYQLAFADDQPVGFAAHGPDAEDATTLWLHKLYVLAGNRRSGVAKTLLDSVLAHAAERSSQAIRLRVNRGNRGAIAAYRRLGFVIETTDVKDIGNGFVMDDYIMRRPLAAQSPVSVNG